MTILSQLEFIYSENELQTPYIMENFHHIKLTTRQTFAGILILPSHNLYNVELDMDNLSGFSANTFLLILHVNEKYLHGAWAH